MKLMNFDKRTLILQNMLSNERETPTAYTRTQYQILCRLIRQKHISKQFFDLVLSSLYGLSDWKELTYQQMYELIHVLTFYNYHKERI